MPKRKTQREKIIGKNEPANKKSLSERTAVTNDLLRNNESRQRIANRKKNFFSKPIFPLTKQIIIYCKIKYATI